MNAQKISPATLDIPVGRGWEVNLILHHDVSKVTLFSPVVSFLSTPWVPRAGKKSIGAGALIASRFD